MRTDADLIVSKGYIVRVPEEKKMFVFLKAEAALGWVLHQMSESKSVPCPSPDYVFHVANPSASDNPSDAR